MKTVEDSTAIGGDIRCCQEGTLLVSDKLFDFQTGCVTGCRDSFRRRYQLLKRNSTIPHRTAALAAPVAMPAVCICCWVVRGGSPVGVDAGLVPGGTPLLGPWVVFGMGCDVILVNPLSSSPAVGDATSDVTSVGTDDSCPWVAVALPLWARLLVAISE